MIWIFSLFWILFSDLHPFLSLIYHRELSMMLLKLPAFLLPSLWNFSRVLKSNLLSQSSSSRYLQFGCCSVSSEAPLLKDSMDFVTRSLFSHRPPTGPVPVGISWRQNSFNWAILGNKGNKPHTLEWIHQNWEMGRESMCSMILRSGKMLKKKRAEPTERKEENLE